MGHNLVACLACFVAPNRPHLGCPGIDSLMERVGVVWTLRLVNYQRQSPWTNIYWLIFIRLDPTGFVWIPIAHCRQIPSSLVINWPGIPADTVREGNIHGIDGFQLVNRRTDTHHQLASVTNLCLNLKALLIEYSSSTILPFVCKEGLVINNQQVVYSSQVMVELT